MPFGNVPLLTALSSYRKEKSQMPVKSFNKLTRLPSPPLTNVSKLLNLKANRLFLMHLSKLLLWQAMDWATIEITRNMV